MRSNKGKDTKPELILRCALRENGLAGYRLQWKVKGRPDIAYPGRKVAIFVNGCFWHRCPRCNLPIPKTHSDFWTAKFERNIERDREVYENLTSEGWTVITIWECEIRDNLPEVISRIADKIKMTRSYKKSGSIKTIIIPFVL